MTKQSAEFKHLLSTMTESHAAISTILHNLILTIYPAAHESVWLKQSIASYGVGPKKMSEHFVYIANYRDHVNLGFYLGAEMKDPAHLLEGTGAKLRHIKIKSSADAKSERLWGYVEEALHLRSRE